MSNLFQKLELEAFKAGITPKTRESREWFRKKLQSMRRVNRNTLMKDDDVDLKNSFAPGAMMMFFYDPKTKDKLPYYDSFPLVIAVEPADKGFYGINLHYLPPLLRAKFLDGLMETTKDGRFDISYNYLKKASKMRYFKACFKHYLSDHVRSRFAFIKEPEWEIATFLPAADFQKAGKGKVYSDSRKLI